MKMVAASSLLLPHEWGIRSPFGSNIQFKGMMDTTHVHPFSFSFASHSLCHHAWGLHPLNNVRNPVNPKCTRLNIFVCRSMSKPGGGSEIPVLEAAAAIFSRSCDALKGSPLVIQLAPAVGIIAFAAWLVGPLMRIGRILLFHKSDNSWKGSGTNSFLTSYLRPLLLWSGAILLCRALDPVVLPSVASQAVKLRLLNFVRSLSTVVAFAYCLSSLIQQTQKFLMETKDSRNMGFEFAGKAVYTAVWVAAVSLFMELLGFSTQKWLTAGGLGTVLLTLAGREILTNFLSSIMIHATRPFALNDWIQTKIQGYEVSGTVEHMGWWSPTVIRGDDREAVHIPNHKFTVNIVRNLSQKTHWRIKTHLAVSHFDVNKISNIVADMRKVLAKNPQIEQRKLHRRIFLDNVDAENQALMILVSCFVKTSRFEEYLCVKEAVLVDLLKVISHHRARLATPLRTYQKVYSEPDVETVPFAETIFSRTRAAANHPLLLIEPPYKIDNDEKTRTPASSAQPNEEKDGRVGSTTSEETLVSDDNKVDDKVSPRLNLDDSGKAKVVSTTISGAELQKMGEDNPVKQVSDKAVAKENLADAVRLNLEDIPSDKGPTILQDLDTEETDKAPTASPAKQDTEPPMPSTSKTILEDNIVLGVALEGSKRTLPIDEELRPTTSSEGKELAAVGKDKEDEPAEVSTLVPRDQQEKGR